MAQEIGPWERYGLPRQIDRPLRFGLLVDGPLVQAWQADSVRRLLDSGVANPALVVVLRGGAASGRHTRRETLAHAAWYASLGTLWRSRTGRSTRVDSVVNGVERLDVHARPTHHGVAIAPDDIARIRATDLDFVLAFGSGSLEGEILEAARHGIWSFLRSDERGHGDVPTAFWELHDGSTQIGIALYRLAPGSDRDTSLKDGRVGVEPASYGRTLDQANEAAIDLPMLVCRDIILSRPPDQVDPMSSTTDPIRRLPGSGAVLRLHGRIAAAAVRRLLFGAFVLRRWSVGRLNGGGGRVLGGQLRDARWRTSGGRTRFEADPMLVPGTAGRVMLLEQYDYRVGRGTIARIADDTESGAQRGVTTLIDEPGVHLSYPSVVTVDDGTLVCTPEAAATGGLLAFRLSADADRVLSRDVMLRGIAALDPTIFRSGDRWWLACTEDPTSLSHLWLFYSDSLAGPWHAHSGNPVVIDVGSARPAGPPFVHDGSLFRPAQDCRGGYGRAVVVKRVVLLTPDEFMEEPVAHLRPEPSGPNRDGLHTISVDGDAIAIDGYRNMVHPLAGWYRLRAVLRARTRG